jgi:hypothetical protein
MSSPCSVDMHFGRGEMVILGTQYAGEMKKGILTLMLYRMPKLGQLCLHSSANEDPKTGAPACFMPCAAPAFAAPALMSFAASALMSFAASALMSFAASAIDGARQGA